VRTVLEHVLDASFSPDGQYLAVCTGGSAWPPSLTVAPVSDPEAVIAGPVVGCDPRWDFDGHYLAYRVPRRHTSHPGYASGTIGVLNTYVGLGFRVAGTWPPAWAPPPRFAITPLTVIAPSGKQVEVMDQRGGQVHTVVSATDLEGVTGGRPTGPAVLLAWSPDGDRLAVGVGGATGGAPPGVVVLRPEDGIGTFTPGPGVPSALGWSTTGSLLVQFDPTTGQPVSEVIDPGGHVAPLGPVRDGTWSADGRWVLARTNAGWFAFDPDHPRDTTSLGTGSKAWLMARWCCPPSAVVEQG
jgi:dipeptidyl aminopeptidase/acylaminoacyl peptidase